MRAEKIQKPELEAGKNLRNGICGLLFALSHSAAGLAQQLPLTDFGASTYQGYGGGLYLDGSNDLPDDHRASGMAHARLVQQLDRAGLPHSEGNIALLSIGMSNTTQEFCSRTGNPPCDPWTFTGLALADPQVNRTSLILVNGARGGQTAAAWDNPSDPNYDRIRDLDLTRLGLTEAQVQVAWVKVANAQPTRALPDSNADAFTLAGQIAGIARAMKSRYPNLRLMFLSSRIYGGYASTALNPEPYAFESGFAVKWAVEAQIRQVRSGGTEIDPRIGALNFNEAPWLGWGPYLWADGLRPRSDGLIWERADLEGDGTHPSRSGEEKVGRMLLQFFRSHPLTRSWFLADGSRRRAVRNVSD